MSKQEVILCKELENDLTHAIGKCPHDKLFILTDEHTHRLCLPQLQSIPALENAAEIIIGAEDVHKNLETLASVWQALSEQGATRHSLLITWAAEWSPTSAALRLPLSNAALHTSTSLLPCLPW